ncbi:MAG: glycosyltransferase family 39 protein, partial [Chloroflexi bacterium]|nr:glycosyltransferase family 39 protein [Chloroflexota bacterium]
MAAFALRVAFLDRQSLWVDEALSVVFADRPVPDLFRTLVTADIHPPLYPLLLHAWFKLAGTSELAARLPSVIFGTLLVPAVYALARALAAPDRRVGRWWGLVTAALVAASPFLVYFSQEARNYSAVTFWVTLALLCLWQALRDGRPRWWAAYGLATLAAIYTHYNAFLMLAAPPRLLLLGWRRFGTALRPWLTTVAVVGVAYLPWAAYALAQLARIDDFWPGTIDPLTVAERTWLAFSGGQGAWVAP